MNTPKKTAELAPVQDRKGPQNMSEKEVNDYLLGLLSSKESQLKGMEASVCESFCSKSEELSAVIGRIQALNQEIQRLRQHEPVLRGEVDAYANLLIQAEDARRAKPEQPADS